MTIKTIADVRALEQAPVRERVKARNVYEGLAQAAARYPDTLAMIALYGTGNEAPVRRITYAQQIARITQTANMLARAGIGPDDVVTTLLPTIPEAFFALWGAETAAVGNPVNWFLEPRQIAGIMREAKAKALIAADDSLIPDLWRKVEAIQAELPHLKVFRVGGEDVPPPGVTDYDKACDAEPADRLLSRKQADWSTVAALFHTGGTTGLPKLARHTHGGQLLHAWTLSTMTDCGPGDIMFNGLPQFHVGGSTVGGLSPSCTGQTVVLLTPAGMRNPNVVRDYWSLVDRYRPTVIGMVPTSLAAVLNQPREGFDLSSVRFALTGGSAAPVEVAKRYLNEMGIKVIEGYGMTEVHGYSTVNPFHGEQRIGSVGLPVPYMEVRIADVAPDGSIRGDMPAGQIGHVLMRGPQVFAGYLDPGHSKGTMLEDGWLDSGDLGRIDPENYVWLTGRAKDLIIRGGHNIDPLLIEEVLTQHPAVETAAAVGRPDSYAGEMPMAFVQLRPGKSATPEELGVFCRARISERAAAPAEIAVIETMPLTGVGKIFKPALRYEAARIMFSRELEELKGEGIEGVVSVGADPAHGTLARITLSATGRHTKETAAELIRGRLGNYTLKYEIA